MAVTTTFSQKNQLSRIYKKGNWGHTCSRSTEVIGNGLGCDHYFNYMYLTVKLNIEHRALSQVQVEVQVHLLYTSTAISWPIQLKEYTVSRR